MARISINLLTVAMVAVVVRGPKLIEKEIYRPYGIKMCEELSQNYSDCFYYTVEKLMCRRVSSNDSTIHALKRKSTGTIFLCPKEKIPTNGKRTALVVLSRDGRYAEQSKGETETKATTLQEPTKNTLEIGELVLSKQIENITLHQACVEGKLDVVMYILSEGLQDINCRDQNGWTPVMAAAWGKQKVVFDFLLSRSCNLSFVNTDNNNILHVACIGGNTDIVRRLLDDQKYDIDCPGRLGWTPVMFAAFYGNKGVFVLLFHKGCSLTVTDVRTENMFHAACRGGNVHIVKYMVKNIITKYNVSVNVRGFNGRTPVMMAAEAGHVLVVDLLLQKSCDMKALDDYGNNMLHIACIGGHVNMVQHIINQNIFSIESRNVLGRTAVIIAAEHGHVEVVDLLVSKGCNLRAVDKDKYNILHIACYKGHSDVVKYIIQLNIVDMESRGLNGNTAVVLAVRKGHIEVVDLLALKGCSLHVVDNDKNTILHAACLGGHVDMVKYIMSKNIVNINVRGFVSRTPVMLAAEMGHVQVVETLMKNSCDMNSLDEDKNSILHVACIGGHVDMVKYIISKHISIINVRGLVGRTPVMTAAEMGHVVVVDILMKNGCDMKALDDDRNNILHVACIGGHVDLVQYIINQNLFSIESKGMLGRTAMLIAVEYGHIEVVDLLTRKHCNLTVVDKSKNNILHLACSKGHTDLVKYAIKLSIVDIESRGYNGRTAVLFAALKGHIEVIDLLVSKGCSLQAVDNYKNTILNVACAGGHVDMVKYIISKHIVSIDARGFYKRTPVMMAAEMGHVGVVKILLKQGCDMKAVDDASNNILHLACLDGHVDMVRYLIRLGIVSTKKVNTFGKAPIQVARDYGHGEVVALLSVGK